ncbi:MAG TPA: zinc ribbon domain-containing protein [Burkholderiales bacterium]|nr:zinc ribbon domain-containing protein [Betaproteobacteria bacterium]HQR52677.1 zinc ribbon domain-containing protein [Burkholderiales bacterium]
MPIYEYRCEDCNHRGEFLQKVSDAPIATCPQCGSGRFSKLISAAGFQLKGSGWYATDFKNGSKPAAAKSESKADEKPAESTEPKESKADDAKPAGSCGSACACHN